MNHALNWRPDRSDIRDLIFEDEVKPMASLVGRPAVVDLRPMMSRIENQGLIGSCTANALAGNLEYLKNKRSEPRRNESRLFIYWNSRDLEGSTDQDSGAYLRDCIKALKKWGSCPETVWPYTQSRLYRKPPEKAYGYAAMSKISSYMKIMSFKGMLDCLADGFPFAFGASWYESFNEPDRGIMPDPSGRVEGGHAMLCVGYDSLNRHFIVRNSWGKGWGDKGYCYFSFKSSDLFEDCWTVRA